MPEITRISEWFAANRHRLTRHGTWFMGGEPNTMPAALFERARLKVLLVRLSQYQDVAAGITHSYLYQMASSVAGCYVDMAFLPPEKDEKLMIEAGVPLLTGTTSKAPACEFDIIAISNSVLQELINLPAMLHFSGLSLSRQKRSENKEPLIVLGGSNSFTHSILHGETFANAGEGLVDAVIVGDGEKVFSHMLGLVRDNKHLDRITLMKLLQREVTGFYDPSSYRQKFDGTGRLCAIDAEDSSPMPLGSNKAACRPDSETFEGGPVLYEGAGSSHVIVSAGCPSFCSFCKESWEQKPYRENSVEKVLDAAVKLKACMGLNEISLMTFNANTCSHVFALVDSLSRLFGRVAIKSQRFDAIVNAPELLDLQFEAGKRTYTCAMEGISDRLRTVLQKNLDEKTILKGISLLLQRNMRQMKVFLILTGGETSEDIEEFKTFLDKLKSLIAAGNSKPRITFSFATLFRAPQTPMQYALRSFNEHEMRQCLDQLCSIISGAGFDPRISAGPEDALVSEYIAYADRRHTPILVEASISRGFRYRGEVSRKLLEFWRGQLVKRQLKVLCDLERNEKTVFPWDDIDTGIDKHFLLRTYNNLSAGKELRPCIAPPWGNGQCSACGACSDSAERTGVNKMGPEANSVGLKKNVPAMISTFWLLFSIPDRWAFCDREFIKAALARKLMLTCPSAVQGFSCVELLEPDFYCSGLAIARVAFTTEHAFCQTLPDNSDENDIRIIKKIIPASKPEETAFPLILEAQIAAESAVIGREIDAFLNKYSLKNQKQRQNGWLNWQINPGQAKKAGIGKICLAENSGLLRLTLLRWPEVFMLNKLFGDSLPRVVFIANTQFKGA